MTPSPTDPIRVLIVDDHHVVRLGLRSLLSHTGGFRVVGEAGSVAESVQMAAQLTPDVVLMDIRLPDGSGVDACRRIKQENEDIRVVMLTSYSDEEAIVGAVMAGASGYLLKQAEAELAGLTDRERRMLALIAEGYTNRAIGEVLHLSEKTVRNHVSQLLRKLGFQRRSQAAAWAGERRLELPPE